MEAVHMSTTTIKRSASSPPLRAMGLAIAVAVILAVATFLLIGGFGGSTSTTESINREQIVVQAEVQDRLDALGMSKGFSADSIVTQAEVQDRLGSSSTTRGLGADPIVIGAEVQDRLGN
jgi:hypothetical protein